MRRIDRHGVLCRAERVNSAVRVLFVTGAQIAQHIVEIRVHALIAHLLIAAAGAFLGAGSQEDFDGRVHQHTRANIAAIHQHGRFLRKAALERNHCRAHARVLGDGGRRHADLRRADEARHVAAIHEGMLAIRRVAHRH